MRARDRTRVWPYLALLLLWALIDFVPVLKLGQEATTRTRVLAGLAGVLGALLAVWFWGWLFRRTPETGSARRGVLVWIGAGLVLIVAVQIASPGVQMIYSATLEGFLCALCLQAARVHLRIRRPQIRTDEPRR